jgi:hypothetical protein
VKLYLDPRARSPAAAALRPVGRDRCVTNDLNTLLTALYAEIDDETQIGLIRIELKASSA